ncbi:MAG TPA: peptidylprolyl isomerase [Fibrobacteraceae bacterium]|nr:peptidylprolyl isomerase [Fibrobacteraceae bacterium]
MTLQTRAPKSGDTIATIKTSQGTMKARIFTDILGETATNFVELAKAGLYKGTPFHRVIRDFMIQGGDFTNKNGTGGHAYKGSSSKIADEYHLELKHIRGALSWAKTSAPCSIGSQFFIVHPQEGTPFLDHPKNGGDAEGYSVFGQLFDGFDVLDAIATTKTGNQDRPVEEILIEEIQIEVMA